MRREWEYGAYRQHAIAIEKLLCIRAPVQKLDCEKMRILPQRRICGSIILFMSERATEEVLKGNFE